MKRTILTLAAALAAVAMMAQTVPQRSTVYFTRDVTPEGLMKVYHALGKQAKGRVAVKISTGETSASHQLSPELMKPLVKETQGTIVECNTAYPGNRFKTEDHLKAVHERGYDSIAPVDIMDAEGSIRIPVKDASNIPYDLVGSHLQNYDFLINLAHFKGHQMGGFGGVLKNQSIGVASSEGKALIHTSGATSDVKNAFKNEKGQDAFLESMAAAAQAVHDYFKGEAVYIDVMNNMSVDCDCNGHPAKPEMKDIGILASLDPVALDKACLDLVFTRNATQGDNNAPLIERITTRHGTHTVDHAEIIGLGTQAYKLIDITSAATPAEGTVLYNVFGPDGKKVLSEATTLSGLEPGTYVVNGRATEIIRK